MMDIMNFFVLILVVSGSCLYLRQYITFKSAASLVVFSLVWSLGIAAASLSLRFPAGAPLPEAAIHLACIILWLLLLRPCFVNEAMKVSFNLMLQATVTVFALQCGIMLDVYSDTLSFMASTVISLLIVYFIWLTALTRIKGKHYADVDFPENSYRACNPPLAIILMLQIFSWKYLGDIARLTLLLFIVAVVYIILVFFVWDARLQRKQLKLEIMLRQLKSWEDVLHKRQEESDTLAIWHHDYRHQMRLINELACRGEYEYLKVLSANIQTKLSSREETLYCRDIFINTILQDAARSASEERIRFEVDCLLPEEVLIDPAELCSILSNILENAIEACGNLPAGRERYIKVNIKLVSGLLNIIATNSAAFDSGVRKQRILAEGRNPDLRTTKGPGHGYGIMSVERSAHCYGGNVFYEIGEEEFTIRIMMENRAQINNAY